MAILNIGTIDMPEPSSFKVAVQDIDSDNTKRNENGVMQRDRIRAGVRKLSCEWTTIETAQASTIMQAIQPASFTVVYFDMETASDKTITAYVGDRSCERKQSGLGIRWDISFDLIEL